MNKNDLQLPTIDFTALPVEEVAGVLRNIGWHLLGCVLNDSAPQLRDYVSPETALLFVTSPGFTRRRGGQLYAGQSWLRRAPAMAWSHLWRLLRRERRYAFADTVERAAHSKLSQRAWQARVQDELEHQLELHRDYRFPPDFWALLGVRAWNDAVFRRNSAELLEKALRQRVLFSAELTPAEDDNLHFPTMLLSSNLFWLLLALAVAATEFNWTYRLFPTRRRVRRALKLLQTEGLRHGLQPGWANVWDQWVLLEAAAFWLSEQRPPALIHLLHDLPLAQYRTGQATDATTEIDQRLIAQPTWRDTMPRWFGEWNRQRRR
jgi:hypothetical protein